MYGKASCDETGVQTESGVGVSISLGVYFLLLFTFGDWSLSETKAWLWSNISYFIWGGGIYIAIGVPWSIFQMWFAAKMRGEEYRLAKIKWLQGYNVLRDRIPDELLSKWKKHVEANPRLKRLSQTPNYIDYTTRITRTFVGWPGNLLWFLFADMLANVARVVVWRLGKTYQAVIDKAYADIRDDFRNIPDPIE
jgi:hypothetical protein